jgi:glutathione reductase (NADPH)
VTQATFVAAMSYDYDYFVIGAGSGGVRSSRIAATHGAKVAIAEDGAFGGTCVNVGCVPKKLMSYGAHYAHDFHDSAAFGWNTEAPTLSWSRFIENKNAEILRLNGIYENLLAKAGVTIIKGRARIVDGHTVSVGDKTYTAKYILIAVGGWPHLPDIPGKELAITSNEAFYLPDLPKRVLIVGGGYIAVEFAGIFNGYGSKVTQLYRGELWLRGFDDDVRKHLKEEYVKQVRADRSSACLHRAPSPPIDLHWTLLDAPRSRGRASTCASA